MKKKKKNREFPSCVSIVQVYSEKITGVAALSLSLGRVSEFSSCAPKHRKAVDKHEEGEEILVADGFGAK